MRRVSPVQTKRGAAEFEAELRQTIASSMSRSSLDAATPAPSLAEFAREWLTTYALVDNKASEVVAKEVILRRHLIPFFGNRRLDDISPKDIEAYKAEKLAAKDGNKTLLPKTVNNHLTVLRKLLVTAQESEHIESVPRIRRLKVPPSKFDWLTAEEGDRFLAAIEKHYPQWRALFWTAFRTGLRRGELFALEWDDLDLEAKTLTVRQSVIRGKLGSPKGGKQRTIPMTSGLVAVLKAHRAETMMKSRFVFPDEAGELTTHQDHVDRPLHGALKTSGPAADQVSRGQALVRFAACVGRALAQGSAGAPRSRLDRNDDDLRPSRARTDARCGVGARGAASGSRHGNLRKVWEHFGNKKQKRRVSVLLTRRHHK